MTHLYLPVVGELHLPAPDEIAFLGGVAALAVVGIVEWPVAFLLAAGHALALSHRNKVVQAFGEALEAA
jgi:hypothetical protein